jgi:hypothetical protein
MEWLSGHPIHPTGPAGAFTVRENWSGGHYELLIALDDGGVDRTIDALAAAAGVRSWFGDDSCEPEDQDPILSTRNHLRAGGKLYGRVQLPSGTTVVCMALLIAIDGEPTLLDFVIPLGALVAAGFPFEPHDERSLVWRQPLDDWLAGLGMRLFEVAPFSYALIGFEATDHDGPDLPGPAPVGRIVPLDGAPRYLPAEA